MNAWAESIRLASALYARLADHDPRGLRHYFTRDCPSRDTNKCLRTWPLRAITAMATMLKPWIKALGPGTVEQAIEEIDIARIDVRNNLIPDLRRELHRALTKTTEGRVRNATNESALEEIMDKAIGDLITQIGRVEAIMRRCEGGIANYEGEEIDCAELWAYDAHLHQTLNTLTKKPRQ